jgi:hypothetical protein
LLLSPNKIIRGGWYAIIKVGNIEKKVYGEDSIQALILSIDAIRRILKKNFPKLKSYNEKAYLSFPYFLPMYIDKQKQIEFEMYIENETKKYLTQLEEEFKNKK